MYIPQFLALTFALAPSLASAAIFPADTTVKTVDAKSFKKVMKQNQTSLVAFVAPWCGHCQKMAPEFSRAALGLYPLLPFYAVDCDAAKNKRLCADQGVKGFPTIKLFPRGETLAPIEYDGGERTASAFFYFASRRIPKTVTKLYKVTDIPGWVDKDVDKPRALLLTKEKKIPLLWQVLGNKYKDHLSLASHRDRKGKSSVALGYEAGELYESKVLIYPVGSTEPIRYQGINKFDSLSKFFDSILDGTADLTRVNEEAKAEEFVPDPKDIEIEQKQEAQRIALAHGGFADLIDFEKAIKDGHGANFHDAQGYPGMMGSPPLPKKKAEDAPPNAVESESADTPLPQTGDAAQVVMEATGETPTETSAETLAEAPAAATKTAAESSSATDAASTERHTATASHTTDEL